MPAVNQIVLPDAQATPVNHTFIPLGPDNVGVWQYEDQSGGISAGYGRLSSSLKRASVSSGSKSSPQMNRFRLVITLPRLEQGTVVPGFAPATNVAYSLKTSVEFTLPDRATLQDRKDILKFLVGALGNSQVVAAVETLQNVY